MKESVEEAHEYTEMVEELTQDLVLKEEEIEEMNDKMTEMEDI